MFSNQSSWIVGDGDPEEKQREEEQADAGGKPCKKATGECS